MTSELHAPEVPDWADVDRPKRVTLDARARDAAALQRELVGGLFTLPASREATEDRDRRAGRGRR